MKKIVIIMLLVIAGVQSLQGFSLTAPNVKPIIISKEVADFVPLFESRVEFNIPDATEQNLKDLQNYLIYQYQIRKNKDKDSPFILTDLDKKPENEWINYYIQMNEPQLIFVTEIAFSLFPHEQSILSGISDVWIPVIERNNYTLGHLLGMFSSLRFQGENDSLGMRIYDSYAQQKNLPDAAELINSARPEVFFLNPEDKKGLPPLVNFDSSAEEDDNKDQKMSRFDAIKFAISGRWSEMNFLEKLVLGGEIPILVLITLCLKFRK